MDAFGRSGGLAVGWKSRQIQISNIWSMESVLGIEVSSLVMGHALTLIIVFGPSQNHIDFWEALLNI